MDAQQRGRIERGAAACTIAHPGTEDAAAARG